MSLTKPIYLSPLVFRIGRANVNDIASVISSKRG